MSQTLNDTAEIAITLNDVSRGVPRGQTVAGLLDALRLDTRKVAIERNRAIVPRSLHADTVLADGDRIEVVHFIGGG